RQRPRRRRLRDPSHGKRVRSTRPSGLTRDRMRATWTAHDRNQPVTGPVAGADSGYPPRAAVTAPVQWALYDSTPGREGDPVLGYSNGALSRANFIDAISRAELGATPDPTQVVVSFLKRGQRPDDRYLALAF